MLKMSIIKNKSLLSVQLHQKMKDPQLQDKNAEQSMKKNHSIQKQPLILGAQMLKKREKEQRLMKREEMQHEQALVRRNKRLNTEDSGRQKHQREQKGSLKMIKRRRSQSKQELGRFVRKFNIPKSVPKRVKRLLVMVKTRGLECDRRIRIYQHRIKCLQEESQALELILNNPTEREAKELHLPQNQRRLNKLEALEAQVKHCSNQYDINMAYARQKLKKLEQEERRLSQILNEPYHQSDMSSQESLQVRENRGENKNGSFLSKISRPYLKSLHSKEIDPKERPKLLNQHQKSNQNWWNEYNKTKERYQQYAIKAHKQYMQIFKEKISKPTGSSFC